MKIAICDDDQILCHHLEEMLLELGRKEQTILQTELFFDGDTLWNYLKQGYRFDLLFLKWIAWTALRLVVRSAIYWAMRTAGSFIFPRRKATPWIFSL